VVHNFLLSYVSDVKLAVGCSAVRIQSPVLAIGRLLAASPECARSLTLHFLASGNVAAIVRCTSTFLASTSAGVRTFRLLLLYI